MKRVIAILVLIFFVGLLVNNFIFAVQENNNVQMFDRTVTLIIKRRSAPETDSIKGKTKSNYITVNKDNKSTFNLAASVNLDSILHYATWYKTIGTSVHRSHHTAAYNNLPKGTKLKVTNINSGDTCIVEVTDVMGCNRECMSAKGYKCKKHINKIDLSHSAFGAISQHCRGKIIVSVKPLIN